MSGTACLMAFVMMGIVTLIGSTKVSFAGEQFADMYRDGNYRATYCAVYHCAESEPRADQAALNVLRTYK